jgi:glycosyltransferase involved in cell wall biosynthesis
MHFTSEEERRLAQAALPWLPAGSVVPLGVEDDLFITPAQRRAEPTVAAPYILSLARLDPKKGLDRLIQAFHKATGRGACRDWRLVIAGDGAPDYVQVLQALAHGGPAASHIAFEGWVTGEARRALLQQASLFALPSSQENFGISVVEAMAAGVPVIVSPGVNLAGDIVAAGAGWMATPDTLTTMLAEACGAPTALRARGTAARQWAERYRWREVTPALLALYADVAGRGGGWADRATDDGVRSFAASGGRS